MLPAIIWLISSELWALYLAISIFSFKHKENFLVLWLYGSCFLSIYPTAFGEYLLFLMLHNTSKSSVSLWWLSCMKNFTCFHIVVWIWFRWFHNTLHFAVKLMPFSCSFKMTVLIRYDISLVNDTCCLITLHMLLIQL